MSSLECPRMAWRSHNPPGQLYARLGQLRISHLVEHGRYGVLVDVLKLNRSDRGLDVCPPAGGILGRRIWCQAARCGRPVNLRPELLYGHRAISLRRPAGFFTDQLVARCLCIGLGELGTPPRLHAVLRLRPAFDIVPPFGSPELLAALARLELDAWPLVLLSRHSSSPRFQKPGEASGRFYHAERSKD